MEWSIAELLKLLEAHDECQRIEAKTAKNNLGSSALETISAFVNEPGLGGGYLLLGVQLSENDSQNRYTIQGIDCPDKLQQELVGSCRNNFSSSISPEVVVHEVDKKILVAAYIPEASSREKPVYIKAKGIEKGSFRRIGSADYRCTSEDLDYLFQLRNHKPYEMEVPPDASWKDIDLDVVTVYRRQRAQVDPNAAELELDAEELLLALKCVVLRNKEVVPNMAGLLLFGSKLALRRMMPMDSRVDYIISEGTEWVGDPSTRYYSTDYQEPLISLFPRLHVQIMGDLLTRFSLEPGQLQRTDIPSIPRDVIREALANSLMHRDYRAGQPTQIIRYSNRLEFRNAGYSLKAFEELGQPGSKARNPIIAAVFHGLKYAETKGTGIRAMRNWMKAAGLTTPPIIETDRERNEFDLVLLPHHLLDSGALEWLSQFLEFNLTDAQRRALVFTREVGAITNQDYRQLNGTDTLSASSALRGLRDIELLVQKGKGNSTYYMLDSRRLNLVGELSSTSQKSLHDKQLTSMISLHDKELTSMISPHDRGKITSHQGGAE